MITDLKNQLEKSGVKYCFNEQEYDLKKIKFIIVGDNPGNTEYKENKFFIGPSGQELRKHFKTNDIIQDFDNECIIFNKTFIHTTKTNDLEPISKVIGSNLFNDIQIHCATEIAKLSNEYNLPILIFGKSNLGPNLLFDSFWKAITQIVKEQSNILVYNHPSPPHLQFNKEWDKYKNSLNYSSNLDLLKKIGTINTKIIKSKYYN